MRYFRADKGLPPAGQLSCSAQVWLGWEEWAHWMVIERKKIQRGNNCGHQI